MFKKCNVIKKFLANFNDICDAQMILMKGLKQLFKMDFQLF